MEPQYMKVVPVLSYLASVNLTYAEDCALDTL